MKKLCPICLLFGAAFAVACGPFFPPSYLQGKGNGYTPKIDLGRELRLIAESRMPQQVKEFPVGGKSREEAEVVDFRNALKKHGRAGAEMEALVHEYAVWQEQARSPDGPFPPAPANMPTELREFVLYVKGVHEMHQAGRRDDFDMPHAWQELLALPAQLRRYRTTWVHYTYGNMNLSAKNKPEARRHYQMVQEATRDGYVDSCALAGACFDKLFAAAGTTLDRLRLAPLAFCYGSSEGSLPVGEFEFVRELKYSALSDQEKGAILDDELAREVLAAAMMNSWRSAGAFLRDLGNRHVRHGERLAFLAYNEGEMELTETFLQATPDDSILKWWLEAKVRRWRGDLEGAAGALRKWLDLYGAGSEDTIRVSFHATACWKHSMREEIKGTLGRVLVEQKDLQEAMHAFVEAGAWEDAAFVAERLLSIDKLKKYVDANCPPGERLEERSPCYGYRLFEGNPDALRTGLRWLLGRRLAREGNLREAVEYLPKEVAEDLVRYGKLLQLGRRTDVDPPTRAAALYNAGKIMRHHGMEMIGFELYPDARIWGGNFSETRMPTAIAESGHADLKRLAVESLPQPEWRFHYRHKAADLMLEAAGLVDDADFRVVACYVGGMWIAGRTPKAADPLYKTLARIHGHPLAEQADSRRWFPRNVSQELEDEIRSDELRTFDEVCRIGIAADRSVRTPHSVGGGIPASPAGVR